MIQVTIEQFEQLLPFVSAASEDVFKKIEPSFANFYSDLIANVVGPDCELSVTTEDSPLQRYTRDYVILAAFTDGLHSHDVIMTDNGFGVVSNENIAPASQVRVDALERELTYKRDYALHCIINRMRQVEGWANTLQAFNTIRSFVWSPYILGKFCGLPGKLTFDDLSKCKCDIDNAETFLRKQLSDALIDQLLDEERNARFESSHRVALMRIYDFIGHYVAQNDDSIAPRAKDRLFESLLRLIEDNIDDFPKYRDSTAYKANHMKTYENNVDDTTFFFAS